MNILDQAIIKNSEKCIEEIDDKFVRKNLLNKKNKFKINTSIQNDSPKKNDIHSTENRKKHTNEDDVR